MDAALSSEQALAKWQILDQRPGEGEQCLVCDKAVFGHPMVEVRHQGRVFHVVAGAMMEQFEADPDRYFRKLQARAVLFDEMAVGQTASTAWLVVGLWVLVSLFFGAASGYLAVSKGRPPVVWFAAGFVAGVVVLPVLLSASKRQDQSAPAGVPAGLAKVPSTHDPRACDGCGVENHPSATACGGCGKPMKPVVVSEVARIAAGA